MPLVRIDLIEGKSADYCRTIGDVVYAAMRATIDVPENDRFQIITEHPRDNFIFDPSYLGVTRSDDCIILQITLSEGRTIPKKQSFYNAIVEGLHEKLGLRREDVFIKILEVKKENWSFGNGIAQYV